MNKIRHALSLLTIASAAAALTACGSSSNDDYVPVELQAPATTSMPAPPTTSTVTTTTTTSSTPDVPTEEEQVDDAVEKAGLVIDNYASAHQFVAAACETFPSLSNAEDGGTTVSQWLADNARSDETGFKVYEIGIPILCPDYSVDVQAVATGTGDLSDGSYEVGTGPDLISPGTWKGARPAHDCYWERTSAGGDIIDNNFVTHATELTVSVAESDGSVTFDGCPTMQFVG